MKFTVWIANTVTGAARYCGVFGTEEEAVQYAMREAARSRKFAKFEVWRGTPRQPLAPVKGRVFEGTQ